MGRRSYAFPRRNGGCGNAQGLGDAFYWIGYHGGGANRSQEPRIAVQVGYNLGWLRQEENQYLAVPPVVARHLPEKLQKLIGYSLGGYALGYFGDVQHPREALKEV